jgi:hypothetical protein
MFYWLVGRMNKSKQVILFIQFLIQNDDILTLF